MRETWVRKFPGLGRCPGEGDDNPLQYFCLENPHGEGYSPWGRKGSDTTERISTAQSSKIQDTVSMTLLNIFGKHSGNEYNNLIWLLLTSLDKEEKEKDELRALNSQLQCHR